MENKKQTIGHIGFILMLLFWFVYGFRLVYDLEFMNLRYLNTDKFYVYSFAFGVSLIPSIAIYKAANRIDISNSLKVCFITLLCSNVCLIYAIFSFGNWNISEILISRANVKIELGGENFQLINPISVSFHGEVLALLSIFCLKYKFWHSKIFTIIISIALVLGITNLIIGNSRGPIVGFIFVLFFELFLFGKKEKVTKNLLKMGLFISVFVFAIIFIFNFFKTDDIPIVTRFNDMLEAKKNNEVEVRSLEWERAWNQFIDSPVVGDAFINKYDNSYCHNLIIEVLMSTGIIGGTFFFSFIAVLVFKLRKVRLNEKQQNQEIFYLILFFCIVFSSMFSGGIFTNSQFWMMGSFLLAHQFNKTSFV
jgi:hypothetical protein